MDMQTSEFSFKTSSRGNTNFPAVSFLRI